MEDIFDLSVSKKELEFVRSGLNIDLEVSADIAETFGNIPYIGSLIKLGRLANKFQDLYFIRKLARFLEKEQDIPDEEKEKFLRSIDKKKRKKMYEYLTHYLLRAEDDAKADIMGMIYCERVYGRITDDMFLRLCSVVDRIFVSDLKYMKQYIQPSSETNYITNNLLSCGLLDQVHPFVQGESLNMGGEYMLNAVGKSLYSILDSKHWFDPV